MNIRRVELECSLLLCCTTKVSIFSEIFFSVENRKKYFFSAEKTEKPKKSQKPKILCGNPKKLLGKPKKLHRKTKRLWKTQKNVGGNSYRFLLFLIRTQQHVLLLHIAFVIYWLLGHRNLFWNFFQMQPNHMHSTIQLICFALVCSSKKLIQSWYQKDW